MTIQKAINDLIQSVAFKEAARTDAKLRVFLGRLRKQEIKTGAMVDLLIRFGYKIEVRKK